MNAFEDVDRFFELAGLVIRETEICEEPVRGGRRRALKRQAIGINGFFEVADMGKRHAQIGARLKISGLLGKGRTIFTNGGFEIACALQTDRACECLLRAF